MSICDWFKRKETPTWTYTVTVSPALSPEPPPPTIESLIDKLTELTGKKPEVAITGKKMGDGSNIWEATIDGEIVKLRMGSPPFVFYEDSFKTISGAENAVIFWLKRKISSTPVETTTITY